MVSKIMVVLGVVVIMSAIALADRKSDKVTFSSDVTLGGATIKAGTYKVQFDYKTNELSILKGDSNKTVVSATGHVEQGERKARTTEVETSSKDNNNVVTSITFGGDNRRIVIDGSSEAKTGSR